jgi:hypothetical protein
MNRAEAIAKAEEHMKESEWGWEYTPDRTQQELSIAEHYMRLAELENGA